MSLLYRSPIVRVEEYEWRVDVKSTRSGRTTTGYWFRRDKGVMWQPIAKYPGRLPKGLWRFSKLFRRSIQMARQGAIAAPGERARLVAV